MTRLVAIAAALGALGCGPTLDWSFSSVPPEAAFVYAEIVEGSCAAGEVVHETRFDNTTSSAGEDSPVLDPGTYCFRGWAVDVTGCTPLAYGDLDVRLPRESRVVVPMAAAIRQPLPPQSDMTCPDMAHVLPAAGARLALW